MNGQELSPGQIIAGKFRLDRVIGRGGMGSVWSARQVKLDMPVALKFMDPSLVTRESLARFEREAKATAALRSPHVVQILDHGLDGDMPFIAMELLEGEDLGERLRKVNRISVPAMAKILVQASKALKRAHEAGILHRDLKPGNVFLARFDEDEIVKLLDFGVAKMRMQDQLSSEQTQTGIVFGSPSYMSPEQARGIRMLDHRTDLWSLAVIAYRAVTGVKPFVGDSIGDLVIKLCIDPLPRATKANPMLPIAIDAFFERAFARDPSERFPSAPAMAAAFAEIEGVEGNVSMSASGDSISAPRFFSPANEATRAPLPPPNAPPPLDSGSGRYPVPPTSTYAVPSMPVLTSTYALAPENPVVTAPANQPNASTLLQGPSLAAMASLDPNVYGGEVPPATLAPHIDATKRHRLPQPRPSNKKPLSQGAMAAAGVGGFAVALIVAIIVGVVRHRASVDPHPVTLVAVPSLSAPSIATSAPDAPAPASTSDAPSTTAASAVVAPPSAVAAADPPSAMPSSIPAPAPPPAKTKQAAPPKPASDTSNQKKPHKPNFGY